MAAVTPHRVTRTYVYTLTAILSLWLVPLGLNVLVDPLWHFAGNQLGPYNYAFNERLSKANLFNRRLDDEDNPLDCLILGSSRTTLLDVHQIPGRNCFNYAVSQAGLADDLSIAEYVLARGAHPSVIIAGLDGFLFSENHAGTHEQMPTFYQTGGKPASAIASYMSIDALSFTLRTLEQEPPNERYYDHAFVVHAVPNAGPFEPEHSLEVPEELTPDQSFNQFSLGPFSPRPELKRFRALFPKAELIAYVPPVTVQYAAKLELAGTLDSYLAAIHEACDHFDAVYDFSIPSSITRDPSNTYDGSHFYKEVNDRIARHLGSEDVPLRAGIAVHKLSLSEYKRRFRSEVTRYLASLDPKHRPTVQP